jgi:hypothetical protein
LPPEIPELKLEHNRFWAGTTVLPSWKGFQSRQGAYCSKDISIPSDGRVRIVFAPEGRGTEPLTEMELSAVQWVVEHESLLSQAVVKSLLEEYPRLQKQYEYVAKERAELMPDVKSVKDLRSLIGLSVVNVHQVQKDGIPYVGFEFGCTWDEEHGLGVLMHGTRTVEIGGADTAGLLWIATEDARKH